MGIYKIYLIRGVKVGCTKEYPKRIITQGFKVEDSEILEEHDDIEIASQREIELQIQYFGKRDSGSTYIRSYQTLLKASQVSAKSPKRGQKLKGTKLSLEFREKLSKAHMGKVVSEKHRKSISDGMKGIVFSDSHKAALKEAWVLRKQKNKTQE
jgi:hypothetical protein